MKSFYHILETPAALPFLLIALILLIGHMAVFLLALQDHKSRKQQWVTALLFLAVLLFFIALLDVYDIVKMPEKITRHSAPLSSFTGSLPWLLFCMLEAVFALTLTFSLLRYRKYQKDVVTPGAIRQAVDLLPEGICISAADGTALLVNLKMDALCRGLTGNRLSNACTFWSRLEQIGEDLEGKHLVLTPQGRVWLFAKDPLSIEAVDYERMSAVDVTESYRITEELREKNVHLQELQRRMREAEDLSAEMFVKQEEITARTALHNNALFHIFSNFIEI